MTFRPFALALALIFVLGVVVPATAQTQVPSPTPATTKLAFDHDGINTDTYKLVVDGVATDLGKLTPVSGQTYETPFPALTPGPHSIVVQACNIAGCSASTPFPVSVVVVPTPPGALRIVSQ